VSKAKTVFERPDPWVAGISKTNMPVRFMIGHLGWAIHIRINLEAMTDGNPNMLTLAACTLQPELQTLIDEAGTLVRVGICEDISKFNDVLQMVSGERLRFYDPVDAAVLARLAGINTPKHSVQNLVWLCLGGYLPKDRASVGDNKWHLPTSAVPHNLRQYLRGDTTQLALAVWVLIECWVMHVFPDLHAVFKNVRGSAQMVGEKDHRQASDRAPQCTRLVTRHHQRQSHPQFGIQRSTRGLLLPPNPPVAFDNSWWHEVLS
jgi:hypothetical protein